jgi:hypothetical protein
VKDLNRIYHRLKIFDIFKESHSHLYIFFEEYSPYDIHNRGADILVKYLPEAMELPK